MMSKILYLGHRVWWSIVVSVYLGYFSISQAEVTPLVLNGDRQLSLADIRSVAKEGRPVMLTHEVQEKVNHGYEVLMQAALNNRPVYGLTVGVGWNKDRPVFQEVQGKRVLSPELLNLSRAFNLSSLRAHASGLGDPMPVSQVRAAMLIRLNSALNGEAGVSYPVIQRYIDFLNAGITPVVPSRGTVGEADITLAAHIGLAMVGEWDVWYQGRRYPAKKILSDLNLPSFAPVGKDFLSILSNNSLMTARAIEALESTQAYYQQSVSVFALALEGFNGNIAPFSRSTLEARPFPYVLLAGEDLRASIEGSDLNRPSSNRALQDPLSFRTMVYTLAEVREAMDDLKRKLEIQVNHSDDNPLVSLGGISEDRNNEVMLSYQVSSDDGAAIIPTANFNFLPISRSVSNLNETLAKLAEVMTQQTLRFEHPDLTRLPRFLASSTNHGHAFGAIQKPFVASNQAIKQLAQPQWFASVVLAGNIEDTATMSGLILDNHQQMIDYGYEIMAYELLHAAQALELRPDFKQGNLTHELLRAYRQTVPFLNEDGETTTLIQKSIDFLKQRS